MVRSHVHPSSTFSSTVFWAGNENSNEMNSNLIVAMKMESLNAPTCRDDNPDGLGEGRGGVAGVRPRVRGLRARDDE